MPGRTVPQRPETAIEGGPELPKHEAIEELARLDLDGVATIVAVTRPGAKGRFPVLVFHHGAGTGNHTAYREHSLILAAMGVVCLTPDKNLQKYSTFNRDYQHMARQYVDLAQWARRQPWAMESFTGYYGESEGAWTAEVSARLDREAGLMVLVSSPEVTPRQQAFYAASTYLMSVGAPAPLLDAAVRFVGATMPPGTMGYGDFDVTEYRQDLTMPVFMAFGTADLSMPIDQAAQLVLDQAPGPVTVRYYGQANHGLRQGRDQRLLPDFFLDLATWIQALCQENLRAGIGPQIAGSPPDQPFWVDQVPKAPAVLWSGGAAATALAAIGTSFARGEGTPGRRRIFTAFRLGTLASFAGYVGYLIMVVQLAANYRQVPWAVKLGYRAVQASGLLTALAGTMAVRRARRDGGRLGAGLAGGALVLALLGYWGGLGRLRQARLDEAGPIDLS